MSATAELLSPVLAGFAPPPELTPSQWADAERVLPEMSAEPGRWRTARTPYLRGIMDAFVDPNVETVVLMKSAQVGGSESLLNVLGYFIAHDPCTILVVQPTIDMAQAFSKDRLATMIRDTPALRAKVREGRGPGLESTLRHKVFPNGWLALAGANSPASLAARAVRVLMCDDVDRFPPVVEEEGDPVDLAMKRTTTFWNRKIGLISTPTLKGGRIDTWYQRSDRRRFFVPCPACERWDFFTWSGHVATRVEGEAERPDTAGAPPEHFRIAFDDRDPNTARIECPCGAAVDETVRPAMNARGEWRPTAIAQTPGLVGFHIWESYSPWVTPRELVAKFLAARARGRESFRVFVNTSLGEGWEDRTRRIEPVGLMARREDYGPGIEAPAGVCCLVAGVDTQDDRFELLVWGVGPSEEKWVVDWRTIPGDPKQPETRAALHDALIRRYRHALGVELPIIACCIDSAGHRTEEVYSFVLAQQHLRLYATIGRAGLSGQPLVSAPTQKRYGASARPVPLYTVNVDDAKAWLLADLRLEGTGGPGYLHFPTLDTVNEAFFAQLTAEQLVTRYTKLGVAHQVWVQTRERNEALDCSVLALAALRLLRPNYLQMAERIRAAAVERAEAPGVQTSADNPPAPPPRPSERQVARSSYLGANTRGAGW
jgi:phage terminase large subunit GpA-like protein